MASVGVAPAGHKSGGTSMVVEKLPDLMNGLKIRDDKEVESTIVNNGKGTKTGHIIVTTTGGKNGQPKQTVSYMAECIFGQASFGIVFQAWECLITSADVHGLSSVTLDEFVRSLHRYMLWLAMTKNYSLRKNGIPVQTKTCME